MKQRNVRFSSKRIPALAGFGGANINFALILRYLERFLLLILGRRG